MENRTEYFIDKVGYYIPFIYPYATSIEMVIHTTIIVISYPIYIYILYQIIKSWKVSEELKSIFYKATIIEGYIDITCHILEYIFILRKFYPPFVRWFLKIQPPVWFFMIVVNLKEYMLIVQLYYTAFISFVRWITLHYPVQGYLILEKYFWCFNAAGLMIGCFVLLQFEVNKQPYKLDTAIMPYSDNQEIGFIGFDVLISFNQPMFLIVSILSAIFTVPALMINIFTLIKIEKLKKSVTDVSDTKGVNKKSQKRMVMYVLIMSMNQFIFMGSRIVIFINPKIGGYDKSILMMFYGLRPYIMHFVCLTSPYALLILNKTIRQKVIKSLGFIPLLKKLKHRSTVKRTVSKAVSRTLFVNRKKNSTW
uniref:Serpentine receptor class gamma n=1 Tax=Strongyloides papillosus TaxID=174720 RepID=A0A0N5BS83_STREA